MSKTKKLNWIANQPTPYYYYFLSEIKKDRSIDLKVFFSLKSYNLLPFTDKNYDNEDIILPELKFFDLIKFYLYVLTSSDQFIVTGWNNKYLFSILLIRRIIGLPYCFYTDSIDPEKYKNDNLIWLKKFLLKKAQFILTTGEFGVKKMIEAKLFERNDRILSLPFFVRPPQIEWQAPKNKTNGIYTFLVLSRLIEWKGVDLALDAFSILQSRNYQNIRLNIGGIGPDMEYLKEKCRLLNLNNLVTFHGWIDESKKKELIQNSVALIHPARGHDPFPLVINECLAMGLPVIGSSKAGSVVEFVKNGYNGFVVNSESAKEIADAILKFVEMPYEDYVSFSKNASLLTVILPSSAGIDVLKTILV